MAGKLCQIRTKFFQKIWKVLLHIRKIPPKKRILEAKSLFPTMRHGDRLDGDADVDGHHIDPHHLPRDNDHRHSS